MIVDDAGYDQASISLAIVDDPAIHELNRRYLSHDYVTDVLSFVLDSSEHCLEGEVIVSVDTADRCAGDHSGTTADELLLYVIHGVLHLVGFDDKQEEARAEMRKQEVHYMAKFGVSLTVDPGFYPSSATRREE